MKPPAPSPVVPLLSLCCFECGGDAIVSVYPGSEADVPIGFLITRGAELRAWCAGCAVRRGWIAEAAA